MAPDIGKIKSNISLMADQGATEEEIDIYVASEGTSAAELSAVPSAAPTAPVERPTNDVLQEMMVNKRPLNEIEDFLKASRVDPTGMMGAVQANMDFMAKNPDFKGERPNIALPQMNPAAKAPLPEPGSPEEAALRMAARPGVILDGIIPNLGANIQGVGGVIGNAIAAPFSEDVDFDPAAAFQQAYDGSKATSDAFGEMSPGGEAMGNATGFGLGMALPATKFMQGGRVTQGALKSGIANGAATGALYGGATGLLNPTGAGRLENGAWGAGAGAGIGAAAAPLIRGLTGIGSWAKDHVIGLDKLYEGAGRQMSRLTGQTPDISLPAREAQRRVAEELRGTKIATGMGTGDVPATAQTISDEMVRRQDMGTPAMPADTSEKLRTLTSWALSGRGPMATRARTLLEARQANQGARIRQSLQAEMGPAVDPIQATKAITDRASADAKPAYEAAYAKGVEMTPELMEIMARPQFAGKVQQAYDNILNSGGKPEEMGLMLNEAGEAVLGNVPTLEALDQTVRAINQGLPRVNGKVDTSGNPAAYGAQQVSKALDRNLRDQNGLFDKVKTDYADEMLTRESLEEGGKVGNLTGHEINAQGERMPKNAKEAWMMGMNTALSDKAVKVGQYPTVNVSRAIRKDLGLSAAGREASDGDAIKTAAIEGISGNPGLLNRIDDRMEAEDQAYKTFNETFGNSKTFQKQATDESMTSGITRAGRDFLMGAPAVAIAGLFFKTLPAGAQKFRTEVQENIANILTETNPANVQEAFQAIEARAAKDDKFKDLLNRAGIQLSRISSTALGGANGDPFVPHE